MKIKIEVDENLTEDEVIIKCPVLNSKVQLLSQSIMNMISAPQHFALYKGDTEYYILPEDILFFETDGNEINVHTADDIFHTRFKLYELEEMLPGYFIRISKSSILNTNQVFAISRSLPTSGTVQFQNTHKQAYVSRYYYKALKNKLEEKRMK